MGGRRAALLYKQLLALTLAGVAFSRESCEYGALPGTAAMDETGYTWELFQPECAIQRLLPQFAEPPRPPKNISASELKAPDEVSMLMIGDSVDRFLLRDLNETAITLNWSSHESLIQEHWRGALRQGNLEVVYQFAPGSHDMGPYHDDVSYDFSIVNAVPRGFEMHRLLTGRSGPNVVTFSNILWDLGRWLFLSEVAPNNQTDYYGLPLLRDSEYLPAKLLEEWRQDTHIQMQRIERYAGSDALLIYHNAAFPKLLNLNRNGTLHEQKGTGRRSHIVQLNALARQIVKERPRWHLVDFGHMSEALIGGTYLRDPHHPCADFMIKAVDIYLNLHTQFGHPAARREHVIGDVHHWDIEYVLHGKAHREVYWQEHQEEKSRWLEEEANRKAQERDRQIQLGQPRKTGLKHAAMKHGYKMMVKLRG